MIIRNEHMGIAIECSLDDIFIDIQNLAIRCRLNGDNSVELKKFDSGDELINGFDHMIQAFLIEREMGTSGLIYKLENGK